MSEKQVDILYYYCSLDTMASIIKNKQIWLNDIRKSNDSKELMWVFDRIFEYGKKKFALDGLRRVLHNLALVKDGKTIDLEEVSRRLTESQNSESSEVPHFIVKATKEEHIQMIRALNSAITTMKKLAILDEFDSQRQDTNQKAWAMCFSEKDDVLKQWIGYGDDGYGVTIGFHVDYLRSIITNVGVFGVPFHIDLAKVHYLKREDDIEQIMVLNFPRYYDESYDASTGFNVGTALVLANYLPPIYKNPTFEDEAEWRIYMSTNDDAYSVGAHHPKDRDNLFDGKFKMHEDNFEIRRNQIITYVPFELTDLKSAIKSIRLGPKSRVKENDIKSILVRNELINHLYDDSIPVLRSETTYQ